jgi:hypothetical protein
LTFVSRLLRNIQMPRALTFIGAKRWPQIFFSVQEFVDLGSTVRR